VYVCLCVCGGGGLFSKGGSSEGVWSAVRVAQQYKDSTVRGRWELMFSEWREMQEAV
jgi:hypothetical protein